MNLPQSSAKKRRGVIIGAGAQGRVTAVVWHRAEPTLELMFLDDQSALWNSTLLEIPISGPVECLARPDFGAVSAILALGHNPRRTDLARKVQQYGTVFARVIDPSAVVMPNTRIGQGVFIGSNAVVNVGTCTGDHVIINTGAVVEHDCTLETGATVAPGARLGGRVHLEELAFVCTGATVIGRIRVGKGAIVGAGSVVTADVPPGCLAYGCPARVVRKTTEEDWNNLL